MQISKRRALVGATAAVALAVAAPARADHYLTHPAAQATDQAAGRAATVLGLLAIANQFNRAQVQNDRAYSLADAMRDAIWRKNTAARLKSLTTAQNACAGEGYTAARSVPLFGLDSTCLATTAAAIVTGAIAAPVAIKAVLVPAGEAQP
jgi:hypothetical protein